jgi:hypothetical protein
MRIHTLEAPRLPAAHHPSAKSNTATFYPPRTGRKYYRTSPTKNAKEINQELHTIPLLSLTLQLSADQEWEGNKPGMAFHPCPYLDTSSSSMCCLLACLLNGA